LLVVNVLDEVFCSVDLDNPEITWPKLINNNNNNNRFWEQELNYSQDRSFFILEEFPIMMILRTKLLHIYIQTNGKNHDDSLSAENTEYDSYLSRYSCMIKGNGNFKMHLYLKEKNVYKTNHALKAWKNRNL
jgi:hypothetical protein